MRLNYCPPQKQQGSMLVISVFIIVVMMVLGLALTNILSAASDVVIYEVYGMKAKNAARVRVELKLTELFPINVEANDFACQPDVFSTSYNNVPGLENCTAKLNCVKRNYQINGGAVASFTLTSTGTCNAGEMTVSRTIQMDVVEQ